MLAIFSLTFPFFALVLCGYLAARRALLPQAAIPGLNGFVLYFALPCLLFRFGANTPPAQLYDGAVFGVYLLCALSVVALTLAVTLRRPPAIGWNDAAFGALVAAFPNTGFMGVPLVLALLGRASSGPVIITIAVDMLVTSSLCIALSRLDHGAALASAGGAGPRDMGRAVRQALRGMLVNPMPWAIVLGALVAAGGWSLPQPLLRTVALLADAASPVALFTIGAVLARAGAGAKAGVAPWRGSVPVALIKLLLHPLLVLAAGRAAMALGLALSGRALATLVLVACLPSASNVAMLAERYHADTGRIARIILVSTVLSFLTFSLAARYVQTLLE